jgi:hypothetical protein
MQNWAEKAPDSQDFQPPVFETGWLVFLSHPFLLTNKQTQSLILQG